MSQSSVFIGRNISFETRKWLIGENIGFEEHSFIQIVLNEPDLSLFSSFDNKPKQFVVSSQWAAIWLVKYHAEIGFGNNDSILCISEKQREICNRLTGNIFVAKNQNSFSLALLIIENNSGKQVVYLHGNRSLNLFESDMKSLGSTFQKAEVYRNFPVLKKLNNLFGVYLFFSPSGAQNFQISGNQIPGSSAIAAIGATTANVCGKLFSREIFVSEKQNELAAVKFAAGLLQNSIIPIK